MYAVIGAGPMGLATARNLQKLGIPFRGFELHQSVGGLWDIDNPHSTMYDSAHLISSKRMTEFAEFPMKEDVAPYPHHSELKTYFQDYSAHFGLDEHFEFNTRVTRVEPEGNQWRVTTEKDGESQSRLFNGVLIANGTLHKPNIPELPGDFSGRLIHSADYRSPEVFARQRVLIVGCGNSGADITVDAVHQATSVDMSVRRGYYFVPKFLKGRPIDTIGGKLTLPRPLKQRLDALLLRAVVGKPSDYGLPDPDYRLYESHPVINSLLLNHLGHGDVKPRPDIGHIEGKEVQFTDGSRGTYDLILMATGYKLHYPFIDRKYLNWPQDQDAPQLYLNCLHPEYDNLFVMGMVEATGLGWEGRFQQARLAALYIRARETDSPQGKKLAERKRRHAGERLDGGYDYIKLPRMAYYVDKGEYLKTLASHIRQLEHA
ncbi:NAD(P)/FAD-dependent oxidoreductase [uncultured Marinobacter sp.]|uniref:flavin-containing monooxygenase n=1 Tax=uncultured Marinobacter sp. TaxID=187379 RepID=UPI002615BEFF|nr:NAD(P)/FAD-dependent oxidoreductase [uncultured Marinobacter sp.]